MLPEGLRRRLEALNRGPLRLRPQPPADAPPPRQAVSLLEALGGREVVRAEGPFHLLERPLAEILPDAEHIQATYRHVMVEGAVDLDRAAAHPGLAVCIECRPEDLVFLDLETCGFSGTPLFLVGLMTYTDGTLTVRQLLARDYSEEAAVVAAAAEMLADRRVLVTFNGRSFDWPHLCERAVVHRVPLAAPAEHVDLLHIARRLWKRDLPNCRLQTLETFVCRRYRTADIPGEKVPDAYHEFVRSGDASRLRLIASHNVMDVVTMAELLVSMLIGRDAFDE